jgi:rhamnose utilization protein RhaD (predicted bifunctional aldolase and dehydrogenase)
MQNRWSESEVARTGGANDIESRLAELVYATRLLGRERDLAMHGAGNTSYKCVVRHGQDQAKPALFVKASGVDLACVEPSDFVVLDHQRLLALVDVPGLADEAFVEALARHSLRPGRRRASVETPMHTVLPQAFVFHTHPNAILALCNRTDGAEVIATAWWPRPTRRSD